MEDKHRISSQQRVFRTFETVRFWRQVRSGNKLPFAVLAGGKDLDVGSAYINCKNIHNGVDGDVSFDGAINCSHTRFSSRFCHFQSRTSGRSSPCS